MALIGTMKQSTALTLRLLVGMFAIIGVGTTACSDLDPVKVESKCEGAGTIDGNCPQCLSPRIASNCPQCQQSSPDESVCLPSDVPWTTETSQSDISTLPDGGILENEGGQANPDGSGAPGESPGSGNSPGSKPGNNDPSNPGSSSTPGSGGSRPGSGGGGNGAGSSDPGNPAAPGAGSAGRVAPNRPPGGCASDDDCIDPLNPACLGDGSCTVCVTDTHCPNGQQCDPLNRCVECVNDDPCNGQGKVCLPEQRMCVQCIDDSNCYGETPACTIGHECVGCVTGDHCSTDRPSCSGNTCVECSSDPDCTLNGTHACIRDEHRCVECTQSSHCRGVSGRTYCDTDSNECVACLVDSDCSDPSAAHCDPTSHSCVPCSNTTQCAAFAGTTPRCAASGECVACDRDGGICNGKACILSTHVCSDKARQSVGACSECKSSDECIAGHVCVATTFGSGTTGNRCLPNFADYKQAGKPCPRPYNRKVTKVDTIEAIRVDTLCALPENTSCPALLDTLSAKDCQGNNLLCGLGQNDGFCGTDLLCTYRCTVSDECPNGKTCSESMRNCL